MRPNNSLEALRDGAEKSRSWRFTGDFGRTFDNLTRAQMITLGADIRRPEGNLLVQHGFTRLEGSLRNGRATHGTPHYFKELSEGASLHLLGFAILFEGRDHGLLIRRYTRVPLLYHGAKIALPLSHPRQLPLAHVPRDEDHLRAGRELLRSLSGILAEYERFVATVTSKEHYQRTDRALKAVGFSLRRHSLGQMWSCLSQSLEKV